MNVIYILFKFCKLQMQSAFPRCCRYIALRADTLLLTPRMHESIVIITSLLGSCYYPNDDTGLIKHFVQRYSLKKLNAKFRIPEMLSKYTLSIISPTYTIIKRYSMHVLYVYKYEL